MSYIRARQGLGDLIEGSQFINKGTYAEAIGSSVEVFRLLQHNVNRFAGVAKFTPIKVDGLIGSGTTYAVRQAAGWALTRFNEHTMTRNAAKEVSSIAGDFLTFAATAATYMQIAEDASMLSPILRVVADVNNLSWMPTTRPPAVQPPVARLPTTQPPTTRLPTTQPPAAPSIFDSLPGMDIQIAGLPVLPLAIGALLIWKLKSKDIRRGARKRPKRPTRRPRSRRGRRRGRR